MIVNMSSMTNTEKEILDAAVRMFSRYGVKRTSMADLAQEAGVSRQTLYNAFRNKDDVLKALIRSFTADAVGEIEAGLVTARTLGDELDVIFDRMCVAGFDLVATMPNAQDLIDGFNDAGKEELEASAETFRKIIERVFAPYAESLAKAELNPADLSEFVQRSAKAASRTARDRENLVRRLQTLKHLCVAAVVR